MATKQPYIFLSHSTKDRDFSEWLADKLRKAEFDVWVDVDSIPDGSTWPREIEKAVTDCAAMVVVMSKSGRESEWVERETLLAMDLRKPLFIAKVDDTPLPLHLINRQFTDFRAKWEIPAQKLIRVLRGIPLEKPFETTRQPENLSPEPNERNIFKYLAKLPGGRQNELIARDLYSWASKHADSVTFGGKLTPAFHARVRAGKSDVGEITVFSLWAYPQQPAVQVNFLYFAAIPPYDNERLRLSTLKSLNELLPQGEQLNQNKTERRPTLALSLLSTADKLETFKDLMGEIMDNLRSEE